jgi:hypothetical protein
MARNDATGARSLTRRDFLDRAGKLACGGLATGVVAASLDRPAALAQTVPSAPRNAGRRPQRVAIVGIDHYHAISPPNYLQILAAEKLDILGIHAPDGVLAAKYAAVQEHAYTDYRLMIDKTKPEFIIALGKHRRCPRSFDTWSHRDSLPHGEALGHRRQDGQRAGRSRGKKKAWAGADAIPLQLADRSGHQDETGTLAGSPTCT